MHHLIHLLLVEPMCSMVVLSRPAATGADAIITGETSSAFGGGMASGDLNADGKTDLVVGAISYSAVGPRLYFLRRFCYY